MVTTNKDGEVSSDKLVIIDFNAAVQRLDNMSAKTGKEKWSAPETRRN